MATETTAEKSAQQVEAEQAAARYRKRPNRVLTELLRYLAQNQSKATPGQRAVLSALSERPALHTAVIVGNYLRNCGDSELVERSLANCRGVTQAVVRASALGVLDMDMLGRTLAEFNKHGSRPPHPTQVTGIDKSDLRALCLSVSGEYTLLGRYVYALAEVRRNLSPHEFYSSLLVPIRTREATQKTVETHAGWLSDLVNEVDTENFQGCWSLALSPSISTKDLERLVRIGEQTPRDTAAWLAVATTADQRGLRVTTPGPEDRFDMTLTLRDGSWPQYADQCPDHLLEFPVRARASRVVLRDVARLHLGLYEPAGLAEVVSSVTPCIPSRHAEIEDGVSRSSRVHGQAYRERCRAFENFDPRALRLFVYEFAFGDSRNFISGRTTRLWGQLRSYLAEHENSVELLIEGCRAAEAGLLPEIGPRDWRRAKERLERFLADADYSSGLRLLAQEAASSRHQAEEEGFVPRLNPDSWVRTPETAGWATSGDTLRKLAEYPLPRGYYVDYLELRAALTLSSPQEQIVFWRLYRDERDMLRRDETLDVERLLSVAKECCYAKAA